LAQPGPGPSQNPTKNPFWIIQKCIQSINPYPIKWIGLKIQKYGFRFEINPFKWIKSNMVLDNYRLDLAIWIFCPPDMKASKTSFVVSFPTTMNKVESTIARCKFPTTL